MEKSRPPTAIFLYPYLVIGNCLFLETVVKGTPVKKKLCNFSAWITGEVIRYNGIDTEVWVGVEGIHASGRKLPTVTVPLNKLSSFEWVDQWGADCILEVGGSVREHIVKAVRETVIHAERKQEFVVTGWKKIGEDLEFLMPGNSKLAVNLPPKLGGYFLSEQCTNEDVETLASLMECKLVSSDILYPLLAYIFLSPLIEFLRRGGCVPKFVLFLVGKTGSRKSTLAALMLSFFGRFTATELPLSFRDTPNSIVHHAFSLKDVPTVIDDFHSADNQEGKKLTATAQSIMLSHFQREASAGKFQNCTYGFIQFLKETFLCDERTVAEFEKTLASVFESRRDLFLESGIRCHGRVPEIVAHLEVSMKILLMFLESRNALSAQRCGKISEEFTRILYRIASQQAENIEKDKPTHISIRKLYSMIQSGQVVVRKRSAYISGDYSPPNFVGYEDNNYYFLNKDAAHRQVKKLCENQGENFSISVLSLTKALAEERFSLRDGSKNTKKLDLGDTSPRMIWLRKDRAQAIVDEVC